MAVGAWEQSSMMKTGNLSNSDIKDAWICRCSYGGSSSTLQHYAFSYEV
ncbi:hypothetical protein A2U01_0047290, partial [Trifolium medium]|nr:hypothetical protein [Trifolium medium]